MSKYDEQMQRWAAILGDAAEGTQEEALEAFSKYLKANLQLPCEVNRAKRDYRDPQLKSFCDAHGIPLADICCLLRDEHFGDELHPNDRGAKIIAEAVFQVLPKE
jgi:lysophospholipase L1-like esterase